MPAVRVSVQTYEQTQRLRYLPRLLRIDDSRATLQSSFPMPDLEKSD